MLYSASADGTRVGARVRLVDARLTLLAHGSAEPNDIAYRLRQNELRFGTPA